jgi:signal transduction histidine kinase
VRVRDDGIGFNTAEALRPRTGHLGLAAMTERLRLVGGVLRVDSDPRAGTTVELEVPALGSILR